jgi:hypothetical protein
MFRQRDFCFPSFYLIGSELQRHVERLETPSPGPPRLEKTPVRSTLSPKGERAET